MLNINENIMNGNIDNSLILTRVYDSPCDFVYKALTQPDHIKKWWNPGCFSNSFCEVKPAHEVENSNETSSFWPKVGYHDTEVLLRIVCIDSFVDETGSIVYLNKYGISSNFAGKSLITIILKEHCGKTLLILQHLPLKPNSKRDKYYQCWNNSLDNLSDYLHKEETNRNNNLLKYIINLSKGLNS